MKKFLNKYWFLIIHTLMAFLWLYFYLKGKTSVWLLAALFIGVNAVSNFVWHIYYGDENENL